MTGMRSRDSRNKSSNSRWLRSALKKSEKSSLSAKLIKEKSSDLRETTIEGNTSDKGANHRCRMTRNSKVGARGSLIETIQVPQVLARGLVFPELLPRKRKTCFMRVREDSKLMIRMQ